MSKPSGVLVSEDEKKRQFAFIKTIREENEARFQKTGKRYNYFVRTYGCQQNENDSEKLSGMLSAMGYEPSADERAADLIIFNTCAVREHAEMKVFGNVGALKPLKEKNPDLLVALCGCMMQQEHIAK
jgi:tRNA-2-methylthio-N6-dimethylallyladenosine synthase